MKFNSFGGISLSGVSIAVGESFEFLCSKLLRFKPN